MAMGACSDAPLFVPNVDRPWIRPDGHPGYDCRADHAVPDGRMAFRRPDGGAEAKPLGVNKVRVWENGPLAFNAELGIAGEKSRFRATLFSLLHPRPRGRIHRDPRASNESIPPLAVRNGAFKVTEEPFADGGRRARNLLRQRVHNLARNQTLALPL